MLDTSNWTIVEDSYTAAESGGIITVLNGSAYSMLHLLLKYCLDFGTIPFGLFGL